jgi:hypothetical protein
VCVARSTWNPIWRLPSTKAKIFMSWLTWDSFWQSPLTKNMFLLQDDRARIEDSSSLIFLFIWDFPNVRVYLIFLSFQGQNHDSLLFINSMILSSSFFLVPNLAGLSWGFFLQQIKNICNVLTLDDMHASLPDLKYRPPPLRCSIVIGCLCLHSKALFVLLMHWLIHVIAITQM